MTTTTLPAPMHSIHDGAAAHEAFELAGFRPVYGTADWSVMTYTRSVGRVEVAVCDDETGDEDNWDVCISTIDDAEGTNNITSIRCCCDWKVALAAASAIIRGLIIADNA